MNGMKMGMNMNPAMVNPMMGFGMPFGGVMGTSFKGGPMPMPVVEPIRAPVLNGVQRKVNAQNVLVQGMAATVKPQNPGQTVALSPQNMGMVGGSPMGMMGGSPFNMGMMGQMGKMGMFPQVGMAGGFGQPGFNGFNQKGHQHQELEVKVDFILPSSSPRDLVVVFVRNAPPSELSQCAAGPVMVGGQRGQSQMSPAIGMPGAFGGLGVPVGMGGLGNAFPFGLPGMSMIPGMGNVQPTQADFGVISEVKAIPGMNSFKIQGLGDIVHSMEDLAGMAVALCDNVVMGVSGPECSSTPMCCVKLGYTENEEPLLIGQVGDYASTPAAGATGAGSVY